MGGSWMGQWYFVINEWTEASKVPRKFQQTLPTFDLNRLRNCLWKDPGRSSICTKCNSANRIFHRQNTARNSSWWVFYLSRKCKEMERIMWKKRIPSQCGAIFAKIFIFKNERRFIYFHLFAGNYFQTLTCRLERNWERFPFLPRLYNIKNCAPLL